MLSTSMSGLSYEFPYSFYFHLVVLFVVIHVLWMKLSPYGHRCKNLHDPKISSNQDSNDVVVLEHCVKNKKYGFTIPDRLYHHQLHSIRQTNPLVAPYIWENCRPARSNDESSTNDGERERSLEWMDTYNLVCNATGPLRAVNMFSPPRKRRTGGGFHCSKISSNNGPRLSLDELQKLCIVMHMRDIYNIYNDFNYAPSNCEYGLFPQLMYVMFHLCLISHHPIFLVKKLCTLQRPEQPAMYGPANAILLPVRFGQPEDQ